MSRKSSLGDVLSTRDDGQSLSRRSVLGVIAATTSSGCINNPFGRRPISLTGVRLENDTNYPTSLHVELIREGETVLNERVSLAPIQESGRTVSFTPGWSVEPARYRIRVEVPDGDAVLEQRLPPNYYKGGDCAYVEVELENGWRPGRTVAPNAEKWFNLYLQDIYFQDDFSFNYCPDQQ